MQVESLDIRNLSEAQAREIAELLVRVWPKSTKTIEIRQRQLLELGLGYEGLEERAPRSFYIREDGELIAHSAVISRSIRTASGELAIAGLTRVCTAPEQRGRGLGEIIVRPVFDLVDAGLFSFSLFQTTDNVRGFYEKLGACIVRNPIVNSLSNSPGESPFWDPVIMRYPSGGSWPSGEIDLCGPGY
ncbi:MAG: GNAT family N-acetyltransferase [Planctomycetales bacterium]|nr:GNAT family N-acetyltransferase [Planctomycetales bacterium]